MARSSPAVMTAAPRLRLYLLGSFRVESEKGPIHLPTRKIESLLAFLALHPEAHSREKLAAFFWGDSPDSEARGSLRKALTLLRKHLSTDLVIADRESIQLNPAFPLWVDAIEFENIAHSESAGNSHQPEIENLKSQWDFPSAIALYRGDLLVDFYDDWILAEREHYHELYLNTLLRLVQELRAQSEYDYAIEYAQKVLASDPANERAHQHLMFCFMTTGNRPAALGQYEKCETALREELAVEPTAETTALYHWIKQAPSERKPTEALITNLPIPVSSFIGRKHEIAELKVSLTKTRLLTLTGAGGSGKTRLAIQVATDLIDSFKDGVWWVELAGLMEGSLVPQTVAKALGVIEAPNQPIIETLAQFLRAKQLLLVLDNCEHLILACAQLAESLLQACPNLKILATSRQSLGIMGEVVWQVPTLSVPDPQATSIVQPLTEYESIRLFVERASAVKSDFRLTEHNAMAVAQICQRLDGIPLAIELAAARTKLLTVQHLAERLDRRFSLLTTGSPTALPRQQTLQATLDWSYDLLPQDARILMRRLSVFAGGFTLEAVETICSDEHLNPGAVLELLARLVDRSLVMVDQQGEAERYRMLETIREYGRDKLADAGEVERLRSRHLDYFVELVERAESEWYGPKRLEWFKRLELEHDNLNVALETGLSIQNGIDRGLRLAGALGHFWAWRTHKAEGRYWLDKLLAASRERGSGSAIHRAKMLWAAGILAFERFDDSLARQLLSESAVLCQEVDDQRGLGLALLWLGMVVGGLGDADSRRLIVDESVAVLRKAGDKWGLGYALGHRGAGYTFWRPVPTALRDRASALQDIHESLSLLEELGDRWTIEVPLGGLSRLKMIDGEYAEARALEERCIHIDRELDNQFGIAVRLMNLSEMWRSEGKYREAETLYGQALETWRSCGNEQFVAFTLSNLGAMAVQSGNLARANALLAERLRMEVGRNQWGVREALSICEALISTAAVWVANGQPSSASRLLGAVEARLQEIDVPKAWHGERAEYERTVAAVRSGLDEATFEAAWAEGRAMTMEQAVELALTPL